MKTREIRASVGQRLLWLKYQHEGPSGALNCPVLCRLEGPSGSPGKASQARISGRGFDRSSNSRRRLRNVNSYAGKRHAGSVAGQVGTVGVQVGNIPIG
jgi:hypothetical protein